MNRVVALILVLLACAPAAAFYQSRDSNYNVAIASTGGYQGPGDIVSGAIAFYSARAYSAAKAGTKAYQVKRASDNATMDINSLASGLPDTTTPATFCAATTCTITIYYDQTGSGACGGSCDLVIGASTTPIWTASSLGGYPCAVNSTTSYLITAGVMSQAQPFTFTAIAERTGSTASNSRVLVAGQVDAGLSYGGSGVIRMQAPSTLTGTTTEGAYHAYIGIGNGASSAIVSDGTATTGAGGSGSISHQIATMADALPSTVLVGGFCEGGIWPSAFNATQYGNMNSNMHSSSNGWNF